MKKYAFLALLFTLFLNLEVHAKSMARVNTKAPDFTLQDMNSKDVSLSSFAGKTVVLEWTNHDCPFVKKHYDSGNMQKLQKEFTEKDIVWLSIISSAPGKQGHVSPTKAQELTKSRDASPNHVLFDPTGQVGRMYGAKTTPHMYIINPTGKLVYAGAIDSIRSANPADIPKSTNYVAQALEELAKNQNVSVPTSTAYGCSIKYKKG